MSSESERRLSTAELKRLNQSSEAAPPPMVLLTAADWNMLLTRLDRLEAGVSAQEALLRALSQQVGQLPTQEQAEALARNVAQMREALDVYKRQEMDALRKNVDQFEDCIRQSPENACLLYTSMGSMWFRASTTVILVPKAA